MNGSTSAIKTALPRMRAPRVTVAEVASGIPVPFSSRTRRSATRCRATKKKSVGGMSASISSLTFANTLFMALRVDGSSREDAELEVRRRDLLQRVEERRGPEIAGSRGPPELAGTGGRAG